MARKKRPTSPPKVPRSTVKQDPMQRTKNRTRSQAERPVESPVVASASVSAASVSATRHTPVAHVPEGPSLAEQYSHVKSDLMRITIFGTLIFAVMFMLKFMGI